MALDPQNPLTQELPGAAPGTPDPGSNAPLGQQSTFTGEEEQVAGLFSSFGGKLSRAFKRREPEVTLPPDASRLVKRLTARTGEGTGERAININFNRMQAPSDVNEIISIVADELAPQMQAARRGKITHEETVSMAADLGLTEADVIGRTTGRAWNAEEITAARYLIANSRDRVDVLMATVREKMLAGEMSPAAKLEAFDAVAKHSGIQAQIHGMAAEAGRALSAYNLAVRQGQVMTQELSEIEARLRRRGNSDEDLLAMAEMWGRLETDRAKDMFSRRAWSANGVDMLKEAWINSLLSGPPTHAVNALGNTLTALWQVPEYAIAGSLGALRSEGGVAPLEFAARLYGIRNGIVNGFKLMAYAMRNEAQLGEAMRFDASGLTKAGGVKEGAEVTAGTSLQKVEDTRRAITSENVQALANRNVNRVRSMFGSGDLGDPDAIENMGWVGKVIDVVGQAIRMPGRALMASDELFKAVNFHMSMSGQAYRATAREEFENKVERGKRFQQILDGEAVDSGTFDKQGLADARYGTFTEELQTKASQGLMTFSAGGGWILVPFLRTPINILSFSLERTPAFAATPAFWRNIKSPDPATRDLAVTKAALGSAAWVGVFSLVGENYLGGDNRVIVTGSGPPPNDRARQGAWRRLGYEPYSIGYREDDGSIEWFSYTRLDPIGQMLGIAADTISWGRHQDDATLDDWGAALVAGIGNNVVNKTYMRGLAEFMEMFTSYDIENYRKYFARLGATVIPTAVAVAERTVDPTSRRTDSGVNEGLLTLLGNTIKSRLPGVSESLPPWRNAWGEVQLMTTALHANWISPIWTSKTQTAQEQELDREVFRLRVPINKPPKQIMGVPLSPQLHDRYIQLAGNGLKFPEGERFAELIPIDGKLQRLELDLGGKGFKDAMTALVRSPLYKRATEGLDPPGQKVTLMKKVMRLYRSAAGDRLLGEFPELVANVRARESVRLEREGARPEQVPVRLQGAMASQARRSIRSLEFQAPAIGQ